MKAVMYFIIMALLLVSLPVRPATATVVDVIDFNKKCILIDSVLDVLLELPRDHTNSAVPNWINRFVVHNKQHLDGKAKGAYNE
ncbi:hypothetical protein [Methyloprofundus sp.]|uniref:hypothetical protein n=1 Tax=Methyloprofundus sp. TaxID=2020875 RepID=UPI003D0CA2A1